MKILLIVTIFLTNILFANYAYTSQNSGEIDMHGGKSELLINNKNSLSNSKFNGLGSIGINKPKTPIAPEALIKEETIEKKIEEKETTK
jgi:hypothetical protein